MDPFDDERRPVAEMTVEWHVRLAAQSAQPKVNA